MTKLEKLYNIFIKSNSELIQQEMNMGEMELNILREEKINGTITRQNGKWRGKRTPVFVI
jgi:hypothetical protein